MAIKIGEIANVTKLAGFEHTKYIQGNANHVKINDNYIPLFIGKTVRDGKIDENFDWYISKELSSQLKRSQLNKKCLVMPYVGSVGDVAIFDGSYSAHLGSNVAKIELYDESKYILEFLYYYIKSPIGQKKLFKDLQGAVQKNITMDSIRNIELPEISVEKQKEIIETLIIIDNYLDSNDKQINILKKDIDLLYNYWFRDFEYTNIDVNLKYDENLKIDIPIEWNVKKLKDIDCEIITGKTPSTKDETNFGGNIPFITIDDIRGNVFIYNYKRYLSKKGADFQKTKYIPENSICVSCIATVGLVGITTEMSQTNQQINSIVINELLLYYITSYLESYFKLNNAKRGNVFDNMNRDDFCNIDIIIPPIELLEKYNSNVKPLYCKIKNNLLINKQLIELKKYLLPLLVNGQIKIEE